MHRGGAGTAAGVKEKGTARLDVVQDLVHVPVAEENPSSKEMVDWLARDFSHPFQQRLVNGIRPELFNKLLVVDALVRCRYGQQRKLYVPTLSHSERCPSR